MDSVIGDSEVPIRSASTVMLLRDGRSGLEVFTLQRAAQMVFAAGMTVFPGGGVDPSDADDGIAWAGPTPDWWARRLRVDETIARSCVVAAARELYEETGVLLAEADPDGGIPPRGGAPLAGDADRAAIVAHRTSFAAVLRRRRQLLRTDLLRPWARWITPPGHVRRYDTYFFVAGLPDGQQADFATSEAVAGGWRRPEEVLRAGARGEVGLMPPTVAMMNDLAEASSVRDILAQRRVIEPRMRPASDAAPSSLG